MLWGIEYYAVFAFNTYYILNNKVALSSLELILLFYNFLLFPFLISSPLQN